MNRIALLLLLAAFAGDAFAANINIGPNGCTLADAIRSANNNSSVGNCVSGSGTDFIIAPDGWVVALTADLPNITSNMTIRSATAAGIFTISGNFQRRILKVTGSNTELTLQRVELRDGRIDVDDPASLGVAIIIENATVRLESSSITNMYTYYSNGSAIAVTNGTLTIDRTKIYGNEVASDAVFADESHLHIVDSEFDDNHDDVKVLGGTAIIEQSMFNARGTSVAISAAAGAGIFNTTFAGGNTQNSSSTAISINLHSNVTIKHITTDRRLVIGDSTVHISNSLLSTCLLNYNPPFPYPISGNFGNLYHDPTPNSFIPNCLSIPAENYFLLPLADYGGPTRTRAIGNANSAAIRAGHPDYCEPFDQRGEARGLTCDVGAYEATGVADVEVRAHIERAAPYVSNQAITVLAEIENNGPVPATNIRFEIDPDFAYVTSVNSPYCPAVPCVIASIQPGQTFFVPIQMTLASYLNSPFSIDLSAHSTTTSTYRDPDENSPSGNNLVNLTYAINQGADLTLTMNKITNGPYFIGQPIQYQATIQNLGPQTSTGTQLQIVPTGLGSVTFTGCASTAGLNCNVANIGNGGSRTVNMQGTVTASQFNAAASVRATQVDIRTFNNFDNTNNGGGISTADVSVNASMLTSSPYYSLDYLEFSITIAAGSSAASNILVDIDFPGAEFIDIPQCANFPCFIPQLAANSQIVMLARYFAPLAVPGVVDNLSIRVRATPGQQDTNLSNNEVVIVKALNPMADIAAQLSLISTPPFYPGQEIQYVLRVPNIGVNTATSVNVTATPQNLTLLNAYGVLCPTVSCTIGQLNSLDEEYITLIYKINNLGAFNLTATANATQHDPNPVNNTDSTNNGGIAIAPPINDRIFAHGFE